MNQQTSTTHNQEQIQARRQREAKRRAAAYVLHPKLQTDRLSQVQELIRAYRDVEPSIEHQAGENSLSAYVQFVETEVRELEEVTANFAPQIHTDGDTIRRALSFLRSFGRIAGQDFSLLPDASRKPLVELLKWEYRWCFAAAGTTAQIFKREIGRTGAR